MAASRRRSWLPRKLPVIAVQLPGALATKQSGPWYRKAGLLRGGHHQARVRATPGPAMTSFDYPADKTRDYRYDIIVRNDSRRLHQAFLGQCLLNRRARANAGLVSD